MVILNFLAHDKQGSTDIRQSLCKRFDEKRLKRDLNPNVNLVKTGLLLTK